MARSFPEARRPPGALPPIHPSPKLSHLGALLVAENTFQSPSMGYPADGGDQRQSDDELENADFGTLSALRGYCTHAVCSTSAMRDDQDACKVTHGG